MIFARISTALYPRESFHVNQTDKNQSIVEPAKRFHGPSYIWGLVWKSKSDKNYRRLNVYDSLEHSLCLRTYVKRLMFTLPEQCSTNKIVRI